MCSSSIRCEANPHIDIRLPLTQGASSGLSTHMELSLPTEPHLIVDNVDHSISASQTPLVISIQ